MTHTAVTPRGGSGFLLTIPRRGGQSNAMEQSFSRRSFMKGVAVTGTVAAERYVFGGEEAAIDVNEYIRAVPKNLPHVVGRKEVLVDDAKHALVHVPDVHWNSDLTLRVAAAVERCQKENRSLLEEAMKSGILSMVHVEGKPAEGEPPFDPEYSIVQTAKEQGLYGIDRIAEIGAASLLAEEGKLTIRGAERTALWNASGPAYSLPYGPTWHKVVLDDREDGVLDIAVQEHRQILWTFFGCWHEWEANIHRWNKKNPKAKFSYLRLTTRSAAEYLKQHPSPFVAKPARAPR